MRERKNVNSPEATLPRQHKRVACTESMGPQGSHTAGLCCQGRTTTSPPGLVSLLYTLALIKFVLNSCTLENGPHGSVLLQTLPPQPRHTAGITPCQTPLWTVVTPPTARSSSWAGTWHSTEEHAVSTALGLKSRWHDMKA